MKHKGRFEVERLDKGYKVSVFLEKKNQSEDAAVMYPEMERLEAATESMEEVHKWIGQFLEHKEMDFKSSKESNGGEASAPKPKGSLVTQGGEGYAE